MADINIIEQVQVGETTYNIASTAYAECNSAADTATKTAAINGFVLKDGVTVHIKFINGNTAANPTLNISSTGAINIANYGTTNVGAAGVVPSWPSGAVVSLTYSHSETAANRRWVINQGYNTNTTYTFANGTNGFTVTPLGGSAQTVTVTPSITNNITGSGTSGYLTKFNGANTITNGPQLASAITNQTTSTKFLREDGTWAAPSYITDTHHVANLITAASDSATANATGGDNSIYLNLVENSSVRNSHNIVGAGSVTVASDASGKITITGNKSGTVTSITPGNGLINGTSGSSQSAITGSGTISIKESGVTNAMLVNKTITIAGQSVELGNSISKATLLSALGIGDAVRYIGTSTTAITDGGTQTPTITGLSDYTAAAGDIVIYGNQEFIWTSAEAWELFGDEGSYALKTNTVTAVTWDSTNNKLTKTINGSTTDVVTASTLKTAMSLNNVSNDANLNSTTGAKGDLIYWSTANTPAHLTAGTNGHFLKLVNGVPTWAADNNDNTKVTQNILATSVTDTYPLLVSYYKTSEDGTAAQTANRVAAIYVQPSTGKLTATEFIGGGSGITSLSTTVVKSALGTATESGNVYLHKSGSWKTVGISVSANNNGHVLADVTFTQGSFPTLSGGTTTTVTVTDAVLTLVQGSNASLSGGTLPTLTKSKANVTISST